MQIRIRGPPRGPLVRFPASPFVAAEFIRDPVRYAECDAVRILVSVEAHLEGFEERFEVPNRVDRLRDESIMVVVPQTRPRRSRARRGRRGPAEISGSDGPSLPPVNASGIICDDEIVHVTAYSYQSCRGTSSKNAAPVMDAAFVISIKTRHDPTELQSPDQHAANSVASCFFCSVIGLWPFE